MLGWFDVAGENQLPYLQAPTRVSDVPNSAPVQFPAKKNCSAQSRLALQCPPGHERCFDLAEQTGVVPNTDCRLTATFQTPFPLEVFKDVYSCQDSTRLLYDAEAYTPPYFRHPPRLTPLVPLL